MAQRSACLLSHSHLGTLPISSSPDATGQQSATRGRRRFAVLELITVKRLDGTSGGAPWDIHRRWLAACQTLDVDRRKYTFAAGLDLSNEDDACAVGGERGFGGTSSGRSEGGELRESRAIGTNAADC